MVCGRCAIASSCWAAPFIFCRIPRGDAARAAALPSSFICRCTKAKPRERQDPVMKDKITVLLCDDHTLFREGIKAILRDEASIEIVGEAENGREAVGKAQRLPPDVVLMDVAMPDLGGFEATSRILKLNPR